MNDDTVPVPPAPVTIEQHLTERVAQVEIWIRSMVDDLEGLLGVQMLPLTETATPTRMVHGGAVALLPLLGDVLRELRTTRTPVVQIGSGESSRRRTVERDIDGRISAIVDEVTQ